MVENIPRRGNSKCRGRGRQRGCSLGEGGLRAPGEDFPLTLNEAREGGVCHGRTWRADLAVRGLVEVVRVTPRGPGLP